VPRPRARRHRVFGIRIRYFSVACGRCGTSTVA
jgi:hypothetical protein